MDTMGLYQWVRDALQSWGVHDRTMTMVLFGMIIADVSYQTAVDTYAEFIGVTPERLHAHVCYGLLAAGIEVFPAALFEYLKWRGEQENENRVSAGKGS